MFNKLILIVVEVLKARIKHSRLYQEMRFKDRNIYRTNFDKNALLCYINRPFRTTSGIHKHSNRRQARIIGEVLSSFGYNVDVVNYQYRGRVHYSKYDLIFGFGIPFENSFGHELQAKRIYYATGAHFTQRDMAEVIRLRNLYERKGFLLKPKRFKAYPEKISASMSDAIFCTGNDWTISTFRPYFKGPIYRTPIGLHKYFPAESIARDWQVIKKNFLWIGGAGLQFKGLDLCLEVFERLPEAKLHICGTAEPEFMNIYEELFSKCANILFHGYIDVSSEQFKKISSQCAYVIFPGASEAGCGSVLTAMSTGLIPIVTKETSIDLGDFGYEIGAPTVDEIAKLVKMTFSVSCAECERQSLESAKYVDKYHSFKKYEKALVAGLESVLGRRAKVNI